MKALCVWEAEPGCRKPLPDQSECGGGWMYVKYPSVCQVTGTGPLDGALDGVGGGGGQCRMTNLRNGNVSCLYSCIIRVHFKII